MSADLIESREARDRNIDRAEVLDKVKTLTMLPGNTFVTVEMAATYFEVTVDAIEWHVRRDRSELVSDGLQVLTGSRLSEFKAESGLQSRAASLTMVPRRAVLRLGMLLRDSPVAKQVRAYLLDTEQKAAPALSELEVARRYLAALEQREADRQVIATQRAQLEIAAPKIAYVDTYVDPLKDTTTLGMLGVQLGVSEPKLRAHLIERRVLSRRTVYDFIGRDGKRRVEYEWRSRVGFYDWFHAKDHPEAPRMYNGQVRSSLYVTPVGKVGIAELLAKHPIDGGPA